VPNPTDDRRPPWRPDPWPPFARSVSPIGPGPLDAAWKENDRASIRYSRRLQQWLASALASLGPCDSHELTELLRSGDRPPLAEPGPGVSLEHGLLMLLARALRLLGQARNAPRRVWHLPLSALSGFHALLVELPPDADLGTLTKWATSCGLDGWIETPGWWHARMEACRDTSRQPSAENLAASLQDEALIWAALERGGTEPGAATCLEVVTSRGELIVVDAASTGRYAQSLQVTRRDVRLGCDAAARALADLRGLWVREAVVDAIGEDEPLMIRLNVAGIPFSLYAESAIVMLRDSPKDVTPDPSLAGDDAEALR
jgi:hypothetical protein